MWEKEIESQQLPGVEKKACVSSINQTGERFLVRIVSEKHYEGWRSAVPTLEEVYLYYFSGTGFM